MIIDLSNVNWANVLIGELIGGTVIISLLLYVLSKKR